MKLYFLLMTMLRSEDNEDARNNPTLALYKIGDSKGIYAVSQAKRFDSSLKGSGKCVPIFITKRVLLKIKYGVNER